MQELQPDPRVHGQAYGQPMLVILPNFCVSPSHPVTKCHARVSDTIIHIRYPKTCEALCTSLEVLQKNCCQRPI